MTGEETAPACPEAITYSLCDGGADAAGYYRDVARFADEVVAAGSPLLPVVAGFTAWTARRGREPVRSDEKYLLELLLLGVHWRA